MRLFPRLTGPNRTAAQLAAVVAVMASLSFAAVPFYDWFCRVTGFGGTTGIASAAPDRILDRTVTVRFDASLARGMPWEFRPMQRTMTVRLGETGLAFYEARNPTGRPVAGVASYNVTPASAGGYFTKIACFCFNEQVLQPGERIEMPVSFYVDPAIAEDDEGRLLQEITLSYTFHEAPLPEDHAAAAPAAAGAVN
jgi:cytochrome c oxidase assembly protein subunit 11